MARKRVIEVFNDLVVSTTAVYTNAALNAQLGEYDSYAIQAVADQVTGTTPTLTVQYEQSNDQRNWANKNGTAEINGVSLSATATNNFAGTDAGTTPGQGFGRFRIAISPTNAVAHVRIFMCQRDNGS